MQQRLIWLAIRRLQASASLTTASSLRQPSSTVPSRESLRARTEWHTMQARLQSAMLTWVSGVTSLMSIRRMDTTTAQPPAAVQQPIPSMVLAPLASRFMTARATSFTSRTRRSSPFHLTFNRSCKVASRLWLAKPTATKCSFPTAHLSIAEK